MRVPDSLGTCLLEVREQAANDVGNVRPTKNLRKMAPSGSVFGQVLLSTNYDLLVCAASSNLWPLRRQAHPFFVMSWFEIISVVILGGLFWLWFDSTRVHEIAVERARSQCHVNEVQFLDDTVALANIKPARDEDGRLILKRTYTFEYSDTGNNRQPGSIIMLGQKVQFLNISPRLAGADITLP